MSLPSFPTFLIRRLICSTRKTTIFSASLLPPPRLMAAKYCSKVLNIYMVLPRREGWCFFFVAFLVLAILSFEKYWPSVGRQAGRRTRSLEVGILWGLGGKKLFIFEDNHQQLVPLVGWSCLLVVLVFLLLELLLLRILLWLSLGFAFFVQFVLLLWSCWQKCVLLLNTKHHEHQFIFKKRKINK